MGSCPAENPLGIFGFNIDTAVGSAFTKIIMPEGAMYGDALAADHIHPGHSRGGIASSRTAAAHVERNDLPMGEERLPRR